MNNARLVRHSVRAMARYKLRSAFIMLGSFVGTAALTFVVAAGAGAERKILSTVRQLFGASSVVVMAGGTQLMGGSGANAARLTLDDLDAVAAQVPEIGLWDAQQAIPDASVRHAGATASVRVLGETERAEEVWQRGVARGENFDVKAVKSSERVALIGETAAKKLFGSEDPVGGEILIGNVPFRIVGVLERFGTDMHGMDRDNEIVVPLSTMMRRVMNVDTVAMAKFLVNDPSRVDDAAKQVRKVLRERHGIPAARPDDFHMISALMVQKMVGRMEKILDVYLPLAAAIILIVAAIVAASLMLASVNERIGEIGLRRAVGARMEDVQLQFLVETASTIVLGGIAGIVAGSVVAQIVAGRYALGSVVSWRPIAVGLLVSIVTGIVAGVLPARRAARLDPIEALR